LCGRYRHLLHAGKNPSVFTTAVARELTGFIWAIACEVPLDDAAGVTTAQAV